MNCRTSLYAPRFLAVAAIAVLVVALNAVPAHAQILNFTGGFGALTSGQLCTPSTQTAACLITVTGANPPNQSFTTPAPSVNGGGSLELTPNAANQSGAAWFNGQQPIAGGFGVEFQFLISNGGTGDGFAFVIQNSSLAAIGGWGGGMAYGTHESDTASNCPNDITDSTTAAQTSMFPCAAVAGEDLGVPNSVAIEFDTFKNTYDNDSDHVAIQSCGTLPNSPDHDSSCLIMRSGSLASLTPPISLANGVAHYVQIVYLPYSATCPTDNPCYNLSVYIDPASNPAAVVQAHVDLNDPCNTGSQTPSGCPSGTILNSGAAWVGFTAATGGASEEADILNFTFTPSMTKTLLGSGVTNSFVFPAPLSTTYNVTYPADGVVPAGTTMTITPTVLPPADCTARIAIFGANDPSCTTFSTVGNDAVIFDVACAQGSVQTQGDANPPSPSVACPTTNGFNPLVAGTFHSAEDISNVVQYSGAISSSVAPQFLTASEGTNNWVAIGVGFDADCCTKGGGTNNYQSQMVLADFPLVGGTSPFAVQYNFIGFTSPVNPPVINSAQAGQVVPFKWTLDYPTCPAANPNCGFNGGPVTNLTLVVPPAAPTTFPFLTLGVTGICSGSSNLAFDDSIPVDTESQTGLMNQGDGLYQYNWKTPKTFDGMALAGQCLVVTADVGDGQSHNADIQFHK